MHRLEEGTCQTLFGRSLKAQFKLKACSLKSSDPFQLSLPQWKCLDKFFYIAFRFVVATILITWLSCEIAFEFRKHGDRPMFLGLTYATEWAFVIFTFSSTIFAAFCMHCRLNKDRNVTTVGDRVVWFFNLISTNSILTTSGIYWIAFWDKEYAYFFTLTSKLKHSIPAILVILDAAINNVPVRLVHCCYPLVLGTVYDLFSFVYWLSGGQGFIGNGVIYPILNWNQPGYAIGASLLMLLFSCIIQALLYVLFFFRIYVSYLVGGRGVEYLQPLCSENADEGQLIAREDSDLLETDETVITPRTYSSLE